ncbi:MAG: hypothetical protein ACXVXD_01995 [Nocardioidaceae bacterium]
MSTTTSYGCSRRTSSPGSATWSRKTSTSPSTRDQSAISRATPW